MAPSRVNRPVVPPKPKVTIRPPSARATPSGASTRAGWAPRNNGRQRPSTDAATRQRYAASVQGLGPAAPAPHSTLARSVLADAKVIRAASKDPAVRGAVSKLTRGDVSGIRDLLANPNVRNEVIDVVARDKTVASVLRPAKITADDLKASGAAAPALFDTVQSLTRGDWSGALSNLKIAGGAAAPVEEKLVMYAGSRMPPSTGVAKALLSDPAVAHALVTDPRFHAAVGSLIQGDPTTAAGELLRDQTLRDPVTAVLLEDPPVQKALGALGIHTVADVDALGQSAADVYKLGQDIANGPLSVGLTVTDLTKIAHDLPADVRAKLVSSAVNALHLPPSAVSLISAAAEAIQNPQVQQGVQEAADALGQHDIHRFVDALAQIGQTMANQTPDAAVRFLNGLSSLPGGLGRLFADPKLNAAVVQSSALGDFWAAAHQLADGNVSGAFDSLGSAAKTFLSEGPRITLPDGKKLPISMQGIENFSRLADRLYQALPANVRADLSRELRKLGAQGLVAVPLVGDAIRTGVDTYQLVQAIRHGENGVDIAAQGGQVALDLAGTLQISKPITESLKLALGTFQLVRHVETLVKDVKAFRTDFAGFEPTATTWSGANLTANPAAFSDPFAPIATIDERPIFGLPAN